MTIVVGYVPKPEGRAALRTAVEEADLRGEQLGKRTPLELGLVGDVGDTIRELLPLLRRTKSRGHLEDADATLQDAAGYLVRTVGAEIATVISDTVARWDAADASRRIELHVGRDLQFIRLNGTVVGALVGLVIHGVSQLLL